MSRNCCTANNLKCLVFIIRLCVSSSLLGPVDPLLRALFGRLKFTVRRHKFSEDYLFVRDRQGAIPEWGMHLRGASVPKGALSGPAVLEATPGQMDGLFSQLTFKCYLPEVECMED